jgi:hypothetical protein
LLRRKTAFLEGSRKRALGVAAIGNPGRAFGEGREFAVEVVLARNARTESAVLETETVKGGMDRRTALPAIGKGEAAERRGIVAFATYEC